MAWPLRSMLDTLRDLLALESRRFGRAQQLGVEKLVVRVAVIVQIASSIFWILDFGSVSRAAALSFCDERALFQRADLLTGRFARLAG